MKKLQLLLLEDQASDVELIIRVLVRSTLHFEITHVSDRNAFIKAIQIEMFDAILSDNNLPQFNATEALTILQDNNVNIPFILVTGMVSEEFAVEMIKNGVTDYILKDRLHRLPNALKTAIEASERSKQRQKIEEKLRHSEKRLRQAQEMAHLGNWEMDFASGITIWSEELCRIYGYPIEDNMQSYEVWMSLIHPDDLEYVTQKTVEARKALCETHFCHRIIRKDGTVRHLYSQAQFETDNTGKPIGMYGIAHDITGLKEKEEEIKQSNERFSLVNKATREAIIDWDILHDATIWGDGFSDIFGYDPATFHNHLWSDNIHCDDREWVLSSLAEKMADPTNNVFVASFRFLKANNDIAYVEHKGIFIRDENGRPLRAIGAMMDITRLVEKRKKIENQNAAFREIAWIQSHVIRSPLATLMGLVELLSIDAEYDPYIIDGIKVSAQNLDNIIRTIVRKTEEVEYGL